MTLGMLSGAVWAKAAWGHYWAWDPKETWAAATWFSYLAYIHFRLGCPAPIVRHCLACLYLFCCCKCVGMASITCPRHKE